MRIDPGMCPLCGNPICTNVPLTCSEICVHSMQKSCYQLSPNVPCKCDRDDLLRIIFGVTSNSTYYTKGYELAKLLIAKLQGKSKILQTLQMLPDDLFEI